MNFYKYIQKKISTKIIFWIFIFMTVSNIAILFSTVIQVRNDTIDTVEKNLQMSSTSIFQSLRNAMNTGDPDVIAQAEKDAQDITGVAHLQVSKSKKLLELFADNTLFTQDKEILKAFNTKKSHIVDINTVNEHSLRMIKPMVASKECLICHTNQKIGDVVGVMDLTFSLEESDEQLDDIIVNIVIISTLLGWLTLGIMFLMIKRTTQPIDGLIHGFENLLASTESHESLKLNITTKDEIGEVSHLFNMYMDKLQKDMEHDAQEYTKSIIDAQRSLIFTTKNGHIEMSNKAFLEFFNVNDLDEYRENYTEKVFEMFEGQGDFQTLELWKEHIIKDQTTIHKATLVYKEKEYIFAVTGNKFIFAHEEVKTFVFTDITELEYIQKEIEDMHKHTRDSIEYASLIQQALIPQPNAMQPYFKDHFTLWNPKDTVGGDIWLFEDLRHEDECLLMFIDCTGHGVPGAFVTMIVKAVEREIVSLIKSDPMMEVSPAWIMGYFNKTIKQLLRQETKDSLSNAGWDGGIIYYNRKEQILKFAGAETSLFYTQKDGELKTLKGNRYSVGYKKCEMDYKYKETVLSVEEGMKFYCTTDGFLDQNGGTKDFPFGKKRFKAIINENYIKPMSVQKEVFVSTMQEYEKIMNENYDRNDDMTVLAFEIGETMSHLNPKQEILKYEGVMTQTVISSCMENIEAKITNISTMGTLSTITIENTQNMMNYSKDSVAGSREIKPAGSIEIQLINEEYYEVSATNIVSLDDKEKIEPKLVEIMSLDKAGIKKRYRELRKSGQHAHEKGGGIGLYEIAKISDSIEYDFRAINEDKYYFTLKSRVKIKKSKSL